LSLILLWEWFGGNSKKSLIKQNIH
jgi:hypothetical protein